MVAAASTEMCLLALDVANRMPWFAGPLVQSLLCLPGGHHSSECWLVWELNRTGSQVLGKLPLIRRNILCIVSQVGRLMNKC